MNPLFAVQVIEGDVETDEDTHIAAWQYLISTGIVWSLQGKYGRTAHDLISAGVCSPA